MENVLKYTTYANFKFPKRIRDALDRLDRFKDECQSATEAIEAVLGNLGFAYFDDLDDVECVFMKNVGKLIKFLRKERNLVEIQLASGVSEAKRRMYANYISYLVKYATIINKMAPYYTNQIDFSIIGDLDELRCWIQKELFQKFQTLVIPNRGEPSNKILDVARIMGLKVIVLCTVQDVNTPLVKRADSYIVIESYTDIKCIVDAANRIRTVDPNRGIAVHPGIGFLAESGDFAAACRKAGFVFIGPSADALYVCDDKGKTKEATKTAYAGTGKHAPLIEGADIEEMALEDVVTLAEAIEYPVVVKRKTGGGGEGIKPVFNREELSEVLQIPANRQSILEKYLGVGYCHIEAQMIGPILLGFRDCSIQTKTFQKLLEFAMPRLLESTKEVAKECCVRLANELDVSSVYTVEFLINEKQVVSLVDSATDSTCLGSTDPKSGEMSNQKPDVNLIEINPRLQIERRISEIVSDVSLIAVQLALADGHSIDTVQPVIESIAKSGYARKGCECSLEARIYAQNTSRLMDEKQQFPNAKGKVKSISNEDDLGGQTTCSWAIERGTVVTDAYNAQIGTVVTIGETYATCLLKMIAALERIEIEGIDTNLSLLSDVSRSFLNNYVLIGSNPTTDSLPKVIDEIFKSNKNTENVGARLNYLYDLDPNISRMMQRIAAH